MDKLNPRAFLHILESWSRFLGARSHLKLHLCSNTSQRFYCSCPNETDTTYKQPDKPPAATM